MKLTHSQLLLLSLGNIVEGFGLIFRLFLVDKSIAAFYNRMQMFNFWIIVVFLVVVHIVNFIEGIFPDILKVNVPLAFLEAELHFSVDASKKFWDVFFLFASQILLILVLKLLLCFESAHSSLWNTFRRFFLVVLFGLFLNFFFDFSLNPFEEMIKTRLLLSIGPFSSYAFLLFVSLSAIYHRKQMVFQFAFLGIACRSIRTSSWIET